MGRRNLSELRWSGMSPYGTTATFSPSVSTSEHRRITDRRASASVDRYIPDPVQRDAERIFLTRSGRIADHKITRLDELIPWRYAQQDLAQPDPTCFGRWGATDGHQQAPKSGLRS
jgi:hypothetical protein